MVAVRWALYADGPTGWSSQGAFELSTVITLANHVTAPRVFVGEISAADQETLTKLAGKQRAIVLPHSLGMRRAGHLAEMAWARLAASDTDDPATLSPIYMQQPDGAPAAQRGRALQGATPAPPARRS